MTGGLKMEFKTVPVVYTPNNEPYLGRHLLFHFDQLICSVMEQNAVTAPTSHRLVLTDHQKMACQVIAQALSIALSIRELIRQGYLFGGHVLVRALAERAAILLYLNLYPDEIDKWNRGWGHKEAPTLAAMFEAIQAKQQPESPIRGGDMTAPMNSLQHSKPDSVMQSQRFWTVPNCAMNCARTLSLGSPLFRNDCCLLS
jgi:hypothetical protein